MLAASAQRAVIRPDAPRRTSTLHRTRERAAPTSEPRRSATVGDVTDRRRRRSQHEIAKIGSNDGDLTEPRGHRENASHGRRDGARLHTAAGLKRHSRGAGRHLPQGQEPLPLSLRRAGRLAHPRRAGALHVGGAGGDRRQALPVLDQVRGGGGAPPPANLTALGIRRLRRATGWGPRARAHPQSRGPSATTRAAGQPHCFAQVRCGFSSSK